MDLLRLFRRLVKAAQGTLFDLPVAERPARTKAARPSGRLSGRKPPGPASQPSLLDLLRELEERQRPQSKPPTPKEKPEARQNLQPTLWEAAQETPRAPRRRDHLIPEKRIVHRGGKVFTQTYWVAPEEAEPKPSPTSPKEAQSEPKAPKPEPQPEPKPEPAIAENQAHPLGQQLLRVLRRWGVKPEDLKNGFWLRNHPPGWLRTSIELHEVQGTPLVYVTHYREDDYGDLSIDSEVVFKVEKGQLVPLEVAYQEPPILTPSGVEGGYERRVPFEQARDLARIMLRNLEAMPPPKAAEEPAPREADQAQEAQEAQDAQEPPEPPVVQEAQEPQEAQEAPPPRPAGFGFDLVKGQAARRKANDRALEIAERILKEGRRPTPEEAEALAAYTGEGGLSGDLNAHYTPTPLAKAMWGLLSRAVGRVPRTALEPSMGAGVFFHTAPEGVEMTGVELSKATATVAKALWGPERVHNLSFEEFNNGPGQERSFEAVIANPPYGLRGLYAGKAKPWLDKAEEYFIDASLDRLEDGGVGVFLINPGPVENPTARAFRARVLARAHVLGVYQLPNSVFKDSNSGVPPVVLVLKKRPDEEGMTLLRLYQRYGEEVFQRAGILDEDWLEGRRHLSPDTLLGEDTGQTTYKGYRDIRGELTPELLKRLEEHVPLARPGDPDLEALRKAYQGDYEEAVAWAKSSASDAERGRIAEGTISEDGKYIFKNHRWHRLREENPVLADAVEASQALAAYANALANGRAQDAEVYRQRAKELVEGYLERHGAEALRTLEGEAKLNPILAYLFSAVQDGRVAPHLEAPAHVEDLSGLASKAPEDIAATLYARKRLSTDLFARLINRPLDEAAKTLRELGYAVDEGGKWERATLFFTGDPLARASALREAAQKATTPAYLKRILEEEAEEFERLARPKRLGEFFTTPRDEYVPEGVLEAFLRDQFNIRSDYEVRVRRSEAGTPQVEIVHKYFPGRKIHDRELEEFLDYLTYNTPVRRIGNAKDLSTAERRALKMQYVEEAKRKEAEWARRWEVWLSENPEHAEEVERAYNEAYPPYIPEPDDESPVEASLEHWRGPALHAYQRAALNWALGRGGGIIALDVGLGKTYTGLALAEKLLQEGQAKRVATVMPKSLLGNWRNALAELAGGRWYAQGEAPETLEEPLRRVLEAVRAHPLSTWEELERLTGLDRSALGEALRTLRARDLVRGGPPDDVLVIGESFDPKRRRWVEDGMEEVAKKLARAALDPSIRHIVITRDWFGRIPLRPETVHQLVSEDVTRKRLEEEGRTEKSARDIAAEYAAAYQKAAAKLFGKKAPVYWEDLGVDALISDEHHAFKNLHAAPQGGTFGEEKPKFIGAGSESKRAFDMLLKTAHLRKRRGGGGVFAMTATPTKNSPLEVYNMLRYVTDSITQLAPSVRAFADRYLEIGRAIVPTVDGGVREGMAVKGWKNLQELRGLMRRHIFRRTAEEVGLQIPDREDHTHLFELPPAVAKEVGKLAAEALKNQKEDPGIIFRNLAKIRALTLDPALYQASLALAENPRYQKAAEIARQALDQGGKVVMFMDVGVSQNSANEGEEISDPLDEATVDELQELAAQHGVDPNLPPAQLRKAIRTALENEQNTTYERLKEHLVKAGIPEDQIAIVTGKTAASAAARAEVEAAYRAGKIRVVIGSTPIIGEGFNLQEDTTDIVHLDTPWDPGTYWQRLGRAVRQGNRQKAVRNHVLLAKGSFDSLTYSTLQGKQSWTDILWNGFQDHAQNSEAMDLDSSPYLAMLAELTGDRAAVERYRKEQEAKLKAAQEVAQREALARRIKEYTIAHNRWLKAKSKDKVDPEKLAKLEAQRTNLLRRILEDPDLPDEVRLALSSGSLVLAGRKGVYAPGSIVVLKNPIGQTRPYRVLKADPLEGKLRVAPMVERHSPPGYISVDAMEERLERLIPRISEDELDELLVDMAHTMGPGGALAKVHPERLRRIWERMPGRIRNAYAKVYREKHKNYPNAEVYVMLNGAPVRVGALEAARLLEDGRADPVLPFPEHIQALKQANVSPYYLDDHNLIDYDFRPMSEREHGTIIKARGYKWH